MNNRDSAEQYFISIGLMPPKEERTERWVLHHKDICLRENNPERYNEWRVEDLIPLTFKEHQLVHMEYRVENNDTSKYGKPISDEMKKQISDKLKGRPSPNKGNHFNKSPEAIERSRQAHLGRKHPGVGGRPKGSPATLGNKGMHWFTNGIENKQAYECPEGFHKGRALIHANTEVS